MKRCRTKFCRALVTASRHSPYCGKCGNRMWKAKNPLRYAFGNLRRRAKQRGHSFRLTFDQYRQFAVDTGYDKLKGKHSRSLSIDRRDPDKGYEHGNIRAVSLSLNSRLYFSNMPGWLKEEMVAAEQASRVCATPQGTSEASKSNGDPF